MVRLPRKRRNLLLLIFILSLTVRFFFCLVYFPRGESGFAQFPDAQDYHQIALNLVRFNEFSIFHGSPSSFRSPLYPFFLSLLFRLFGTDNTLWTFRLANCLLSSITTVLVFLIGNDIYDEYISKPAALAAIFYPPLVFYTGFLISEVFYTFLSTTYIFFQNRALNEWNTDTSLREKSSGGKKYWVLSGLVLGLMILTKSNSILILFLLPLFIAHHKKKIPGIYKNKILPLFITATIVFFPWTIRNTLLHESPVLFNTNSWKTLYGAHNGPVYENLSTRGGWIPPETTIEKTELPDSRKEVGSEKFYRGKTLDFVIDNPVKTLLLLPFKVYRLFNPLPRVSSMGKRLLSIISYGPVILLALLGRILFSSNGKKTLTLDLFLSFVILSSVIIYGSTRFRYPLEPVLLIFAARGLRQFKKPSALH